MPSRISKGFSLCTAIIGVLCLLTGISIAICAWVLNGKLPDGFTFTYKEREEYQRSIMIGNYWWGGMIYIVPGIVGIIAGCSRNICAMVLYLIVNLVCCICSLIVVVLSGLVLVVWVNIDYMLQEGECRSDYIRQRCNCNNGQVILNGGSCNVFMDIQVIIGAMISMAALSSLLSFIASYVSCCSLCNQENEPGQVIITGGCAGVYQPPPVVVSSTTVTQSPFQPNQMPAGYPPPPYVGQAGYNAQYGGQQAGYNAQYGGQQAGYNAQYGGQAVYSGPYESGYPTPYSTSDTSQLVYK